MVLCAACGPSPGESGASTARRTGGPSPPAAAVAGGEWRRIEPAPFGWYRPEGAFWIDGTLVVVAASAVQRWDPETGRWRVVAEIPQADECEGCGYSQTVVWTGDELLMWGGGFMYRAPDGSAHAGAAVDLAGRIEPLPPAPIPVRWWHQSVWTGEELVVFGGGRDTLGRRDGAAFDPATGTWRKLPRAPVGGYANSLVWTGAEMITWGGVRTFPGRPTGSPRGFVADGAAYDPASGTWRELAPAPLDARGWHTAVWTGTEMIVWGGMAEPRSDCYDCGYPDDAAAYDPATDTWRTLPNGPLAGRVEHSAVWTGEEMIVYGGSAPGGGPGKEDGAIFDPAAATWSLLPEPPIAGRYRHRALWTGGEMIVWGGQNPRGQGFRGGGAYRPE